MPSYYDDIVCSSMVTPSLITSSIFKLFHGKQLDRRQSVGDMDRNRNLNPCRHFLNWMYFGENNSP